MSDRHEGSGVNQSRVNIAALVATLVVACTPLEEPSASRSESLRTSPSYEWTRTVHGAATVEERESGSVLVSRPDGTQGVLGLDAYHDESGTPVAVDITITQDAASGPVEYAVRAYSVSYSHADASVASARHSSLSTMDAFGSATLGADLRARAVSEPTAVVDVLVVLRSRPTLHPRHETERQRVALSLVPEAAQTVFQEQLREYERRVDLLQAPTVDWIVARGGVVLERFWLGNILHVQLPAAALPALAALMDVAAIHENRRVGWESVDGWAVSSGTMSQGYVDSGYDGARANPTRHGYGRITLGVIDASFDHTRPVFRDSSTGGSRVLDMYDCAASPCRRRNGGFADHWSVEKHGTMVAGLAVGDLTDGQDSSVTDPDARRRRSGMCPECGLVVLKIVVPPAEGVETSFIRAVQRAGELQLDGVSFSGYFAEPSCGGSPCDGCLGDRAADAAVNDLVRITEVFFVKSAGNQGHSAPTCTITSPGGAAYSFTTAGTLNAADVASGDWMTVRSDGPISTVSSRGGTPYLSGSRTIVDTALPAGRDLMALPDGDTSSPPWGPAPYTGPACCGTSFAAPQLLGFVGNLRDWWLDVGWMPFWANHPSQTTSVLLLFGDRQGQSGTLAAGFDPVWGNGRFRARRFQDGGVSAPWGAGVGSVQLPHGSSTAVYINDGIPLPSSANRMVVVMWWPEAHFGDGTGADIILELISNPASSIVIADFSFDTKKRVHRSDGGGKAWQMVLHSYNGSAGPDPWDPSNPGALRRTLYYAWYYESCGIWCGLF